MNRLPLATLLPVFAIATFGNTHASARDLTSTLECRAASALTADIESVARIGRANGYDCRTQGQSREPAVYCTGDGGAVAFGHRVREFNLAQLPGGRAILSVAFAEAPSRIEPAVKRTQSSASVTEPLSTATVEQREDGVAELRCIVPGDGNAGGSLAGRLDFRGMQPIPPMRVCAAPVNDTDRPYCVETVEGQHEYAIANLPHGDYFLTAFPLQKNPNRLFAVYGRPLQHCLNAPEGCVSDRLQRVSVFPGEMRQGIDPATWVTELPRTLRPASSGSDR